MYACMALKTKSFCLFDFMKAVLPASGDIYLQARINATAAEECGRPHAPICITSVCQHKGLLDVDILPVPGYTRTLATASLTLRCFNAC